jgi:2-hydroxy-3-keto-5-methylthiopentenyl-1-phosphate phosphatase
MSSPPPPPTTLPASAARPDVPSAPRAHLSAPPTLSVVLDFDGTLVEPNVAIVLVTEFAPDGARIAHEIDILLHEGKIGLREAWQRQAALLPGDRIPEMARFVRDHVPLRRGARELLELLRQHRVPVTVVSGGLEFYIREVLDREHLDLPILSDHLVFDADGSGHVTHPHGHPTCRVCGICKAGVVQSVDGDHRTVFIADGSTDRYGAEVADIIFARRRLLDYCRRSGLPVYPFEDFEPVTEQFHRWLEQGEPLPPPRRTGLATSICPLSQEAFAASNAPAGPLANATVVRDPGTDPALDPA